MIEVFTEEARKDSKSWRFFPPDYLKIGLVRDSKSVYCTDLHFFTEYILSQITDLTQNFRRWDVLFC